MENKKSFAEMLLSLIEIEVRKQFKELIAEASQHSNTTTSVWIICSILAPLFLFLLGGDSPLGMEVGYVSSPR